MHNNHNREVTINKDRLIEKIIENRNSHVKDYEEALVAYKKEAAKQLRDLGKKLKEGKTNLALNLVTPVNRIEEYNKIIEMFQWDVRAELPLTQREFNEYVHDDHVDARTAKFINSSYK